MILLRDAGYQGTVALSASSTLPVSASISRCASAWARRGTTSASAAARTNPFSAALRSQARRGEERREVRSRGTIRFRSFATFRFTTCLYRSDGDEVLNGEGRVWRHVVAPARTAGVNLYRLGGPEQRPRLTNSPDMTAEFRPKIKP